ncbi:FkbM family methyltransferase [Pseudovibrio sp. SPO723]|uniref:FkbM family methyltransferase n=1 Tax=Nesiotobacter zosterae TaxID=392721 RepID=UPI0029C41DCA|nr:FkbM family methyltransferase [Pseudovibrio sp. SPO723]MDX5594183.1 FkbM family methyltransferase [Pseudovibrio sp. SPO723]
MTSIPYLVTRLTRAAAYFHINLRPVERFLGYLFDLKGGVFVTEGLRFEIPKQFTSSASRGRFMVGAHEWNERRLITRYLSSDAHVLELGGGLGVVSCVINRRLADPARHVVLDADPRAVTALTQNRNLNGARFSIVHGVISAREQETVYLAPTIGGSSLCRRQGRKTVKVPGYSIEELERQHDLSFDCFIVDIEGSELRWAEENKDALRQVQLLVLEVHPTKLSEAELVRLRNLLRECGLFLIDELYEVEVWRRQPLISA